MMNNAVYLTASEMRDVGYLLGENAYSKGTHALEEMFLDLARRYPSDSFKVKVILALNAHHEKGSTP